MSSPLYAPCVGRRLWSLLGIMRQFSVAGILMMHSIAGAYDRWPRTEPSGISAMLDRLFDRRPSRYGRKAISDDDRTQLAQMFQHWADRCSDLDLAASTATIRKMLRALSEDDCTYGDVWKYDRELRNRVLDDADGKFFLALSMREAEFYAQPQKGWEAVIKRFPAATTDIEELSRCFALGRYAAAVFHSVQVVEVGLSELCKALESKDPHSGWTAAAKALDKVVNKKHDQKTDFERKHSAFFEQVQGTVEGLKNAWRNKISHAHGRLAVMTSDFAPDVAEEIIFASRAFMRRLATDGPTAQATILDFPAPGLREAED